MGCVGFEFETGYLAIGDAAGDDPLEFAQIGCDIQREAVRCNTLRDVHADGGDFLLTDAASGQRPHAGELADALGHHAELAAGADQDLFQQANIIDRA